MTNNLISIVLPVYNGEKYLSQSIESIIDQTYKNWELIIVNDCSTDLSLPIAEEYALRDSRIKVFSNEKNIKLPRSLNAGFDKASGEYYTWTSDDNIYKSNALEILIKALESDYEAVMAYTDMDIIDSAGKILEAPRINFEPYMLAINNCCGACFLYRSDAAKAIGGYNPDYFLAEDYEYWIRLLKFGKLKHISESPYYYRVHSDSLSETKKAEVAAVAKQLINDNFDFLHKVACDNDIEFEFFENMLMRCSDEKERRKYRNKYLRISKNYFIKKLGIKTRRIIKRFRALRV